MTKLKIKLMPPKRGKTIRWVSIFLGLFLLFLLVPVPRFNRPFSTVVTAADGSLLGAHIAEDGQWRFPAPDSLPTKYKAALLSFEDEYFYYHPGVNPWSIIRAFGQNISRGHIVSGGSTISMQVARMAGNAPRTLGNKIWEIFRALRLELSSGKEDILITYAANAPFGGNIVGFETASWHYFERPPRHLTWAESALLAVLPNAPGMLRPGTNSSQLKAKRDRLLKKLFEKGHIDQTELSLSIKEPLPEGARQLPSLAPHLVDYYLKTAKGQNIITTIDPILQSRAAKALQRHSSRMAKNHIRHAGALIAEIETGHVLAYIGNSAPRDGEAGHAVDMIRARRSSGSILKPFLYSAALQDGSILPHTLLADVPTQYQNYAPQNFHRRFDGAVPANEALSRSLNVPFVRLLHQYGGERFLKKISETGITTLNKGYDHYGLSLILGGGEVTLWELAGSYASMARILRHYRLDNSRYRTNDVRPVTLTPQSDSNSELSPYPPVFSAGAAWWTLEAMKSVVRPPEEAGWENFTSQQNIAWKTGTSFGYRDAWSVGVNGRYVVAVWMGNASGEGRSGLLGGTTAGPLMFRLFDLLPNSDWFDLPHDDMKEVQICSKSGYRAGPDCPEKESQLIPSSVKNNLVCPYHKIIHLTPDHRFQTRQSCEPDGDIVSEPWFVLPPLMAWYYSRQHSDYRFLPPRKPGCFITGEKPLDFIYPNPGATIMQPVDLDGEKQKLVFKVVHANPEAKIYWHLDNSYLGQTQNPHEIELDPDEGLHRITVVDEDGNRLIRRFRVVEE
ncbi:penicillin-binding protein 1C [Marinilabilia rubra]|nr:penicillin-binding protein 1C [Marinilabilia rubra]